MAANLSLSTFLSRKIQIAEMQKNFQWRSIYQAILIYLDGEMSWSSTFSSEPSNYQMCFAFLIAIFAFNGATIAIALNSLICATFNFVLIVIEHCSMKNQDQDHFLSFHKRFASGWVIQWSAHFWGCSSVKNTFFSSFEISKMSNTQQPCMKTIVWCNFVERSGNTKFVQ